MTQANAGSAVRAAEKSILDAGHGEVLMRRSAWGLARLVVRELRSRGTVAGSTVAALVGTGNNGGDALWAPSFLRRRGVNAVAVPTGDRMHEAGLAALRRAGGLVADRIPEDAVLLVDGVLGTGKRGGWEPPSVPAGIIVVACDLPSGVDADTGHVAGGVIPADLTVTYGGLKAGLMVGAGAHAAGRVELVDIGLGLHLTETDVSSLERDDVLAVFGPPAWRITSTVAGCSACVLVRSSTRGGGAVLVCSSALASGLGVVQNAGPQRAADLDLKAHPEVVASSGAFEDGPFGT